MPTALIVGEDSMLLQTRAAVLSRIGVQTVCASPSAALAVQAEQRCEMAVLCHSMSEADCKTLVDDLRRDWPKTQVLKIVLQGGWGPVCDGAEVDGISSPEPERLMGTASQLLQRIVTGNDGDIQVRGGVVRAGPFAH